jgi:hypothetical protein
MLDFHFMPLYRIAGGLFDPAMVSVRKLMAYSLLSLL